MSVVGLRKLRQHASELVRRVKVSKEVTITVPGRESARLVPVAQRKWHKYDEIAEIFRGPGDLDWVKDRDLINQQPYDPS